MVSKQFALILSVDAGPIAGKKLVIPTGESRTVGRTNLSDLATEDGFMSGVHFCIESHGDYAQIRDMGSTNKTYVNGVAIASLKLSPKDRIRAGKTLFSIGWETSLSESAPVEGAGSIETMGPGDWAVAAMPNDTGTNGPKNNEIHESIEDYDKGKENHSVNSEYREKPVPELRPIPAPDSDHCELPTKRKNLSPFESVDQSFAPENFSDENLSWGETRPAKSSSREFSSPFDDSVDLHALVDNTIPEKTKPETTVPKQFSESDSLSTLPPSASESKAFWRLRQRPTNRTEYDFSQIVARLKIQNPCRIVAHFQKIGERVPKELPCESVIPNIGQGKEYFPVLIERENWQSPKMIAIANRLVMSDGIMLVIVNESLDPNETLQKMSSCGAPGFSDQNGLLAWFWPSQIYALAESLSDSALSNLFRNKIEGIVAAVPQMENDLYAVANQRVTELLEEFGFTEF